MRSKAGPEFALVHMPLMQLVGMHRERYPDLLGLIHVPHEAVYRLTQKQIGVAIGMGMRPGVSDLLLLRARRGYHGLAIELKAPGKLPYAPKAELEQKSFLRQQAAAGWLCCFCDDAAAAWQLLAWYLADPTKLTAVSIDPTVRTDHFIWYIGDRVLTRRT